MRSKTNAHSHPAVLTSDHLTSVSNRILAWFPEV